MQDQIHVCSLNINATNLHTNDTFKLKRKLDTKQTTRLTFRVNNTELPFDEDYTVTMGFENPQTSQKMTGSIDLSESML